MHLHSHLTVGIIGGAGKTGRQFARLFQSQGLNVRVTGKSDRKKNAELVEKSDIVVFSLPLEHAAETMHSELKRATRTDQLILDVSSLKVREVRAMLRAAGEVIGMHPLFGPLTNPRGQTVILCPARCKPETLTSLRSFFSVLQLKTIVMTPKEHDDLMAVIQVIPHFKSFLMAELLAKRAVDFARIAEIYTPTYELEFNIIGRFLDDQPELYMPIIFRNPRTPAILRQLRSLLDDAIVMAETQNIRAASQRYRKLRTFFSAFLSQARAHSEACINALLHCKR